MNALTFLPFGSFYLVSESGDSIGNPCWPSASHWHATGSPGFLSCSWEGEKAVCLGLRLRFPQDCWKSVSRPQVSQPNRLLLSKYLLMELANLTLYEEMDPHSWGPINTPFPVTWFYKYKGTPLQDLPESISLFSVFRPHGASHFSLGYICVLVYCLNDLDVSLITKRQMPISTHPIGPPLQRH